MSLRKILGKSRVPVYLLVIAAIVILVAWQLHSRNLFGLGKGGIFGGAVPAVISTASETPIVRLSPSQPAGTITPSLSPITPTSTPTVITGYTLETPIGPAGLIIHRVTILGESLNSLSQRYGTQVEAIRAINYNLQLPLQIGMMIVIPANRFDVSGLPPFEVYKVTKDISTDDLVRQLSVNEDSLNYYNALHNGEIVTSGGWLIIPRMGTATPKAP